MRNLSTSTCYYSILSFGIMSFNLEVPFSMNVNAPISRANSVLGQALEHGWPVWLAPARHSKAGPARMILLDGNSHGLCRFRNVSPWIISDTGCTKARPGGGTEEFHFVPWRIKDRLEHRCHSGENEFVVPAEISLCVFFLIWPRALMHTLCGTRQAVGSLPRGIKPTPRSRHASRKAS